MRALSQADRGETPFRPLPASIPWPQTPAMGAPCEDLLAEASEASQAGATQGTLEVAVVNDLGHPLPAGVRVTALPYLLDEAGQPALAMDGVQAGVLSAGGQVRLKVEAGRRYGFWVHRDSMAWVKEYVSWRRVGLFPAEQEQPFQWPTLGYLPLRWDFLPPPREARVGPGESLQLRLVVPRLAELSGRVEGVASEALERVRVTCLVPGSSFDSKAVARVDAQGRFKLLLYPGAVQLSTRCSGYSPDIRTFSVAPGARLKAVITLTGPGQEGHASAAPWPSSER